MASRFEPRSQALPNGRQRASSRYFSSFHHTSFHQYTATIPRDPTRAFHASQSRCALLNPHQLSPSHLPFISYAQSLSTVLRPRRRSTTIRALIIYTITRHSGLCSEILGLKLTCSPLCLPRHLFPLCSALFYITTPSPSLHPTTMISRLSTPHQRLNNRSNVNDGYPSPAAHPSLAPLLLNHRDSSDCSLTSTNPFRPAIIPASVSRVSRYLTDCSSRPARR